MQMRNTGGDAARYDFEIPQDVLDRIRSGKRRVRITEEDVCDLSFVDISSNRYIAVKRALDILISLCALIVFLIPIAVIALVVYISDPGEIIFSQYRIGLHGKRFKVYKFRTMRQNTPKYMPTTEVKDPEQYITKTGSVLRKFSLDELPQLLNVLKGDMSLIGPRPLIADEIEMHSMRMRFGVYNLRPGITGLAQINGRDTVPAVDKIRWDVKYLEKFSFGTDLRILAATFPQVFGGCGVVEGYNSEKHRNDSK